MPLSRIITRTPQDAVAASEYLRSQGYTVETVSPEEFRITPAEVELNLDRCSPAEAVERAQALVESRTASTAVAAVPAGMPPQEGKIAVAYDITGRPVEFADQEEVERRQKSSSLWRALAAMLHRGWVHLGASLAGAWQSVKRPAVDFQRKRVEQHLLKFEAQLAREREEIRSGEELARERVRQETERQRQEAERAERQRPEQIAAERQAEQERARVAALHEAMIAAQRAAAPQQPPPQGPPPQVAPAVTQEAASANLNALLPPVELQPMVAAAKETVRSQPPRRRTEHARPLPERPRPLITVSRTAVATACGLSLLLLLGFVAYANRRSASPLSPGILMKDVKQTVPFGAATINPPAATSKPVVATPAGKHSPAVRRANQMLPAARPGARRLHRPLQDDSLGDNEIVVRHLKSPPPKPQPSTAKLKRHSDLE